jgi:ribosomal protein S18 acetylase RimI-like enzyme
MKPISGRRGSLAVFSRHPDRFFFAFFAATLFWVLGVCAEGILLTAKLLRIRPTDRDAFLPLLLLADESEQQVRSYMYEGDLYAYFPDGAIDSPAGVILAIETGAGVELKAVAVRPEQQGQGVGLRMLRAVLGELRSRGVRRVVVGTANAGIGQLAYYQKAGFRLQRIERDFFSPARGYPEHMEDNGIRLRDMVWMDQELSAS